VAGAPNSQFYLYTSLCLPGTSRLYRAAPSFPLGGGTRRTRTWVTAAPLRACCYRHRPLPPPARYTRPTPRTHTHRACTHRLRCGSRRMPLLFYSPTVISARHRAARRDGRGMCGHRRARASCCHRAAGSRHATFYASRDHAATNACGSWRSLVCRRLVRNNRRDSGILCALFCGRCARHAVLDMADYSPVPVLPPFKPFLLLLRILFSAPTYLDLAAFLPCLRPPPAVPYMGSCAAVMSLQHTMRVFSTTPAWRSPTDVTLLFRCCDGPPSSMLKFSRRLVLSAGRVACWRDGRLDGTWQAYWHIRTRARRCFSVRVRRRAYRCAWRRYSKSRAARRGSWITLWFLPSHAYTATLLLHCWR